MSSDRAFEEKRAPLWFFPVGIFIGWIGTLCGIGGGLFAGPLLHLVQGQALKRAAATALCLVFATTSASTVTEALQENSLLSWRLILPLVAGVLAGAQAGFFFAQRLSERRLKMVFVFVMFFAGLRILFPSAASAELGEGVSSFGVRTVLAALCSGFGGGFVSPILGVGGGLLMVPGLFFAIDGLSFTTARATSLAGGMVGSFRSIWLHARAGNIAFALGIPLALGALIGASVGVFAARYDPFVQLGKNLLGVLLVAQSIRLARQTWGSQSTLTERSERDSHT
ncbi:MAG: hypothetical protein CMJ89_07185 [Planctomycetes bacterium]|jgi:uncharacterized membrane protein YfcA|nr:hypothetical protein [Planctomycetota bacterium]